MKKIMTRQKAVSELVQDGDAIALEGFTHLIPFAAGHEIIRQRKKDLTLIRMTPDVIYDQLIGMGCARKMVFSWGGNPGVGSLHRFRDVVEKGWPHALEIEEHTHAHADMANAYDAGAANLAFAILRGYLGSDIPRYTKTIKQINCPFSGEAQAAVPAIRPDVTVIHALQADRQGNVLLWGIVGVQKEAELAVRKVIVTVEEVVDVLKPARNQVVFPGWVINAVCEIPGDAFSSYAQGYYTRDNAFYQLWDAIALDRNRFRDWMQKHILETADFSAFRLSLEKEQKGRAA